MNLYEKSVIVFLSMKTIYDLALCSLVLLIYSINDSNYISATEPAYLAVEGLITVAVPSNH